MRSRTAELGGKLSSRATCSPGERVEIAWILGPGSHLVCLLQFASARMTPVARAQLVHGGFGSDDSPATHAAFARFR